MTSREDMLADFLASAGWQDAAREPLAGDLSARRYIRLRKPGGTTAVLMDAPPDKDPSTPRFMTMTGWLRSAGLSAPQVFEARPDDGMLLLEDLGDAQLAALIRANPLRQADLTEGAVRLLLRIRELPAPVGLAHPSAADLVEATRLADEWYPGVDAVALDAIRPVLETRLAETLAAGASVSLRDFHSENLIWLEDRADLERLGILDYQDAMLTHPAYDLMSLLTDARIDVHQDLADRMIAVYARLSGDEAADLSRAVAVLGVQRNLRILGIFARAARRDGKTRHLSAIPRVHRYLARSLAHPVFAGFGDAMLAALPVPGSTSFGSTP